MLLCSLEDKAEQPETTELTKHCQEECFEDDGNKNFTK